jgi:hypothetical protein
LKHVEGKTGVRLVHADKLPDDLDAHLDAIGLPAPAWAKLPDLWRFSFWSQRELLKRLREARKQDGTVRETVVAAVEYLRLINDAVFFSPDIPTRVSDLLESHRRHRFLARSVALELETGQVVYDAPGDTSTFKAALFDGKHFAVQGAMYLSHRARLYILKAAVDYAVGLQLGTIKTFVLRLAGKEIPLSISPYAAFGAAVLRAMKSFAQLPTFWQALMWSWGGFILADREKQEFELLARETGILVEEIPTALTAFDKLFPVPGGWFRQPKYDQRRVLMQMPAVLRGMGAVRRLAMYAVDRYDKLGYKDSTASHMAQDHNAGARLLNESNETGNAAAPNAIP